MESYNQMPLWLSFQYALWKVWNMKIALVHWRDAWHKAGDVAASDLQAHYLDIFSSGLLIEKSEESIKIGMDYCPETDDYRELAVIPIEYVQSFVSLDIEVTTPVKKKPRKKRKD